MSYEQGFSHKYPLKRGLFETLEEGSRIIKISDFNTENICDISYPIVNDNFPKVVMPLDARDLASYVRMAKSTESVVLSGILLGIRLKQLEEVGLGCPVDTVINRFSIYSSNVAKYQKFGGIDIKLLPPFDLLGGSLSDAYDLLDQDLNTYPLSLKEDEIKTDFKKSVLAGAVHVL